VRQALKIPFKKQLKIKYKYKGGDVGEIVIKKKPETGWAHYIKDLLGVNNICEELEYVRVYDGSDLIYTYPCGSRKRSDELDTTFEDLKKELLREVINEIRSRRKVSLSDMLAQFLAEQKMLSDLYNVLKEQIEPKTSGFKDLVDFIQILKTLSTLTPQQQQVISKETIKETLTNTTQGIADVLKMLSEMPQEEREKLVNEAMQNIMNKFRESKS